MDYKCIQHGIDMCTTNNQSDVCQMHFVLNQKIVLLQPRAQRGLVTSDDRCSSKVSDQGYMAYNVIETHDHSYANSNRSLG